MISRHHRFIGPSSLRFVFKQGKTIRGPFFTVKSVLNNRRQSYRAAVVISRKVHKSAVIRNRLRRRIYEALRQIESDIVGSHDIVINVFSLGLMEESAKSLQQQLQKQLTQAGVIAKRPKP